MVLLHIYGALAILLLFGDQHDTESESYKNDWFSWTNINKEETIKGSMVKQYPYPKKWVKILW